MRRGTLGRMKVTVELDSAWAKIAQSPIYMVVSALTGVSITFAPLFLYWSGKGKFFPGYEWIIVPLCFATIYFVCLFYILLGSAVARGLRQSSKEMPSIAALRVKGSRIADSRKPTTFF
jgi:hypothetical protein